MKQVTLKLASTNDAALTFHPIAAPWPLIKGRRFDALVADITANGLQQPIVLYQGKILDGRNRWRACVQSGIAIRSTEYLGNDPAQYIDSSNQRRNLTDSQRAMVAAKQEIAKWGDNQHTTEDANWHLLRADLASRHGVSVRTIARAASVLKSGDAELIEAVEQGDIKVSRAAGKVQASLRRAAITEKAELVPNSGERHRLVHGSVTGLLDEPAGSVDLIITDPPYPREFIPLYGDLARGAAHVLRPGGLLICMAGQSWIWDVGKELSSSSLEYLWMICYLTPGGQAVQVFPRRVNSFWKPVLIYGQGPYLSDWFSDATRSEVNDNDKKHHYWGQSESGMRDLMRRFVRPGHVVMDPFLGGGTTAVVALEIGASFIGFDVNAEALVTTRARIANV